MSDIRTVTVLTPCYNEAENVRALYERVRAVFDPLADYRYEHVFIDNASTDDTVAILRDIAARDRRVKVIVNTRNFGHVRSPYHALLQCRGDAVIGMAADLQDPPELIPAFLEKWREGYKVVLGIKSASEESAAMFAIRRSGYGVIDRLSEVKQVRNSTGFGLYDKAFVSVLRRLPDPYPYFRGIVAELGFRYATVPYTQPKRTRGITKNNLYMLYDLGVQGIVNHSKIPLRLATIVGFCSSVVEPDGGAGLLRDEDVVLVRPADRHRAAHHRPVLRRVRAAVLPRRSRRVRRFDLYAGPQSPARRRGRNASTSTTTWSVDTRGPLAAA